MSAKKVMIIFVLIFLLISSAGIVMQDKVKEIANNYFTTKQKSDEVDTTVDISKKTSTGFEYVQSLSELTVLEEDITDLKEKLQKKLKRSSIILISSFHMTNDWNKLVSQSAIDIGESVGAEVILTNAEGNWNRQVNDIEKAIRDKVDAIIVAGGISNALQEVIKKADDNGICVVTVDIPSPFALTNVTSDNYSLASMLIMKMALNMEGEGNIVVIYPPGWHSIDIRRNMLGLILKEWPNIHIVAEYPVDEEDAINGTKECIENVLNKFPEEGSIDAIFTTFGLAGVGAAEAVEEADRMDHIPVYTVDADRMVLEHILKKDGGIGATMGQDTLQLGKTATLVALKGIIGETEGIYKQYFCPISLVTKENALEIGQYLYGEEWFK
ncbi:MAG: sugar transporter substrate-binding protein [Clostridia bacterium]|jgi:simple sugar transport system substrate-binding protein|nr:sugar transporter substrate-binding protein [Clostridia bacterium]